MRGQERRRRLLNVWSTRRGYDAVLPDTNIIDQKRDKATFYSPTLTLSRLANFRPITFKTPSFKSELFNLSRFKSACGYSKWWTALLSSLYKSLSIKKPLQEPLDAFKSF